jgi:hypothetical protein
MERASGYNPHGDWTQPVCRLGVVLLYVGQELLSHVASLLYFFCFKKKNQNQKPPTAVRLPPLTRSANHRHSLYGLSLYLSLWLEDACFCCVFSLSLQPVTACFCFDKFFLLFLLTFFGSSRCSPGIRQNV